MVQLGWIYCYVFHRILEFNDVKWGRYVDTIGHFFSMIDKKQTKSYTYIHYSNFQIENTHKTISHIEQFYYVTQHHQKTLGPFSTLIGAQSDR